MSTLSYLCPQENKNTNLPKNQQGLHRAGRLGCDSLRRQAPGRLEASWQVGSPQRTAYFASTAAGVGVGIRTASSWLWGLGRNMLTSRNVEPQKTWRLRGISGGAGKPAASQGCAASPLSTCARTRGGSHPEVAARCHGVRFLRRERRPVPLLGRQSTLGLLPSPPSPGVRTLGSPLLQPIMLATLPTGARALAWPGPRRPDAPPPWPAPEWHALPAGARRQAAELGGRRWRRWRSWCGTSWIRTTGCAGIKALMDQVRPLLCLKADLRSQARPPACPVAFPETFRVCEGCCSLPWTIWATWEVPELVTPPGTPTESWGPETDARVRVPGGQILTLVP